MLATPLPMRYRRPAQTAKQTAAPSYLGLGLAFSVVAGIMLYGCLPEQTTAAAQTDHITVQPN